MRIITDHHLARAVISSDGFSAYSLADSYRALGQHLGHDFGPVISLFDRLPTFLDGEAHREARRALAHSMSRNKAEQVDAARNFLTTFGATKLQPGSCFDLLEDLAQPLYRAISSAGSPSAWLATEGFDLVEDLALLFSPATSLKKRFGINRRLADFTSRHGTTASHELGLLMLGIRPLTGSLALSLYDVLAQHPDAPLSAMVWPARLAHSALSYVDRICERPTIINEEHFEPGEHIRCVIQSPDWSAEQRQAVMFGAGAHACLGRPLSDLVWTMSAACFAAHDPGVAVEPLRMRHDSDPFDLPARTMVTILA
jgi:cytochrome P450